MVIRLWVFLLALLNIIESHHIFSANTLQLANNNDSPCPDVFQYYYEHDELRYGFIQVKVPRSPVIQLTVQISVGNHVESFNGDLVLAKSKMEIIEDIMKSGFINYKLYFPRWIGMAPKITKITMNRVEVCTGPAIELKTVRVLTTINLQHTLRLNVPEGSDGQGDLGFIPAAVEPTRIDFNPTPPKDLVGVINPFIVNQNPFGPNQNGRNPFNPSTGSNQNGFGITFGSYPVVQSGNSNNDFYDVRKNVFGFSQKADTTTSTPEVLDISDESMMNHPLCGLRVPANALVANGQGVERGEYPWLVAMFVIQQLGPEFRCGGTLISKRHVITAAHCVKTGRTLLSLHKVILRLGENNIHRWTDTSESKTIGAANIQAHPQYRRASSDSDVAVITLLQPVQFTNYIRPICMWTGDTEISLVKGFSGTVAGWGHDENNAQVTSEPKQVTFPVVSQEECLRAHDAYKSITSTRTFCAGYRNGAGPCNGDSGGGFIMNRNNRWTLRGIVSMSLAKDNTCDYSQYFVFTDVAKYLDWIQNVVQTKVF